MEKADCGLAAFISGALYSEGAQGPVMDSERCPHQPARFSIATYYTRAQNLARYGAYGEHNRELDLASRVPNVQTNSTLLGSNIDKAMNAGRVSGKDRTTV